MRQRLTLGLAALALLAGCGGGDADSGGVTAEESRQLNEAAEMLDASPDSLVAGEDDLGNGDTAVVAPEAPTSTDANTD